MSSKSKISDLKTLQLAKVELKSQILKNEHVIEEKIMLFKENLFDSTDDKNESSSLFGISSKLISNLLSSFIITKMVKPRSKTVKKAAIFFSSLIIQKYGSKLTDLLVDFLKKPKKDINDEQIT